MPRNSFGVMSLEAGNPVVSDTVIETSWANPTLDDIANEITGSVPVNGSKGMTAALKGADGAELAPMYTFTNATGMGMWKDSNDLAFSVGGVKKFSVTSSGVVIPAISGSISLTGNLTVTGNTALTGSFGVTGNSTFTGNVGITGILSLPAGAVGAPSLTWAGDTTSGFYRPAANQVGLSISGTELQHWSSALSYVNGQFGVGTGTLNSFDNLRVGGTFIAGATGAYGVNVQGTVPAAASAIFIGVAVNPTAIAAGVFTEYRGFDCFTPTLGGGATIGTSTGFHARDQSNSTTGIAFRGAVVAGATKYNLYMDGTAQNVIAGSTRLGSTVAPTEVLDVTGNIKVSGTANITGALTAGSITGSITPSSISPFVGPFRNALINGNLEVWQRNTTFSTLGASDSIYTADRWVFRNNGTGRTTISYDATPPTFAQAGIVAIGDLKAACTTANASPAAADYCSIQQKIEGYLFRKFHQRALVLTFWVKASQTGTFACALQSGGGDRFCIINYTVNVANTWEFKTCVFPASPSAGSWNYATSIGAYLIFTLSSGVNSNGTAGSWQTGSAFNVSGNVNFLSSTSNTWQMTMAQLEVGAAATEFEDVPFDIGLARCMRYYEKTFDYAIAPAQAVGTLANGCIMALASGTTATARWTFAVRKRIAVPTVVTYNPTQANANWRNSGNSADATVNVYLGSEAEVQLQANAATDQILYQIQAAADAEL